MALSGSNTWDVQRTSGYLKIKMDWSATQNIAGNYSDVKVNITVIRGAYGYNTNSTADAQSLWIDGTKYTATSNVGGGNNSSKLIMSQTKRVYHNADGTKSFSMQFQKYFGVWWGGTLVGTQTFPTVNATLNTIPRASSISSISGGTLGSSLTVNISRAASSFTHRVGYYRTDGKLGLDIIHNVGTSTTFTLPIGDSSYLPNVTSGTAKIVVDTYSGSTRIGSTSKNFKVTVPTSVVPNISNITFAETTTGLNAKFGAYVQNKSSVKTTMKGNGAYGSTIRQKKIIGNGQVENSFELNTDVLSSSGINKFTYEVIDSRGRKASATQNITVLPYIDPQISALSVIRCNSYGTPNNEGTYAKVTYNASIAPVNNKNDKTFKLRWRKNGEGTWSEKALSNANYTLTGSTILSGFSVDNSYEFQLVVTDYFVSVIKPTSMPSGYTLVNFHQSGKAMAFGGVMERPEGLDVFLNTEFKQAIKIATNTVGQADDWLMVFNRLDGTYAAGLSLGKGIEHLKLHLYGEDKGRKTFAFGDDGNLRANGDLFLKDKPMPLLWSGALYMQASHTIEMTKPLDQCRNGWVLYWSDYEGGVANNWDWCMTFIPKSALTQRVPGFHQIVNHGASQVPISKYLYITNNTSISGHANNTSNSNQKNVVLRAVYEW
ncbi:DUF859 family phage minor structural protein [Vagococcus lutrae]|uniref:DUF859 family phage minor structural protein n=1 Tax=Vagococcus lutrae TaxID=81947 RepID=UPI002892401B|nr:DUF859 family phage minor structural protein [Vagococcus lutrae]MDT2801945.1 DUF859 family phage minor structural protein [Vagococcus lutrae]